MIKGLEKRIRDLERRMDRIEPHVNRHIPISGLLADRMSQPDIEIDLDKIVKAIAKMKCPKCKQVLEGRKAPSLCGTRVCTDCKQPVKNKQPAHNKE